MDQGLAEEVRGATMPEVPELRPLTEKEAALAARNFELDRAIAQLEERKLDGIHRFQAVIKKLQAEKRGILDELDSLNEPLPLFEGNQD